MALTLIDTLPRISRYPCPPAQFLMFCLYLHVYTNPFWSEKGMQMALGLLGSDVVVVLAIRMDGWQGCSGSVSLWFNSSMSLARPSSCRTTPSRRLATREARKMHVETQDVVIVLKLKILPLFQPTVTSIVAIPIRTKAIGNSARASFQGNCGRVPHLRHHNGAISHLPGCHYHWISSLAP